MPPRLSLGRHHLSRWLLPIGVAFTAVPLPLAVGAGFAEISPSSDVLLAVSTGFVCLFPLGLRAVQRRFDLFDPIVLANVSLLVMFSIHPIGLLVTGTNAVYKGYYIAPDFHQTLILTLIGAVGFQLGYAISSRKRTVAPPLGGAEQWDYGRAVVYGIVLAVLGFGLFFLFIQRSGGLGVLSQLLKGRSAPQDAYFRSSTAYLYGAPQVLVPASLLILGSGMAQRRKHLIWLALVTIAPLALFEGARGTRSILLPLLMTPLFYYYIARGRRPGVLAVVIASYLLLTVGLAFFRDIRDESQSARPWTSTLVGNVRHPGRELHAMVVDGVDVDMFESIAIENELVKEGLLTPSPVDFARRLVAKPVPSILWKAKPTDPDEYVNDVAFPNKTVRASNSTGPMGSFYYAGGGVGIAVGMFVLGVLLRIPWDYWKSRQRSHFADLLLATVVAFTPVLFRAGIADGIARALFIIVPIIAAPRLLRHRSRAGEPRAAMTGTGAVGTP